MPMIPLRRAGAVQQDVALRQVEQMADLGRMQPLDRQQVLLPVGHAPRSQKPAKSVNFGLIARVSRSLCSGLR